jgi:phage baseplate assembly protein W
MQPNLGLGLRRFLFEQINQDTNIMIENEIVDTLERWMPFVELKELDVDASPTTTDRNQIKINITFSIRRAPDSLESVGVVLG